MVSTRSALREVLRPWWARVAFWVPIAAGFYQFGCDQFSFPTLPELWGMTGTLVPWWGWLLIAQAIFVAALFEYVRRNASTHWQQERDEIVETETGFNGADLVGLLRLQPEVKSLMDETANYEMERMEFLELYSQAVRGQKPMPSRDEINKAQAIEDIVFRCQMMRIWKPKGNPEIPQADTHDIETAELRREYMDVRVNILRNIYVVKHLRPSLSSLATRISGAVDEARRIALLKIRPNPNAD